MILIYYKKESCISKFQQLFFWPFVLIYYNSIIAQWANKSEKTANFRSLNSNYFFSKNIVKYIWENFILFFAHYELDSIASSIHSTKLIEFGKLSS